MQVSDWTITVRIVLACLLGGFIGLERESHGRPAGLRTHILVCVGSALVMLVSAYALPELHGTRDPLRLAAQVVSGIGFLGAGTIMQQGANIRGLTTAASLWVVAGIGLAVGSGFYLPAVLTTVLAVTTLTLLDKAEQRILTPRSFLIEARIIDRPGQLGSIAMVLGHHGLSIRDVDIDSLGAGEGSISLQVEGRLAKPEEVVAELMALEGVLKVRVKQ